jgi:zinc resistance-associated protein
MKTLTQIIIGVAVLALISFGGFAFAHGGMSGWNGGAMHGGYGMMNDGYGMMHGYGMMNHGGCNDHMGQLAPDQQQQLEKSRQAFNEKTKDLRAELYDKQGALENELAKTDPNIQKASSLQKDISELRSQIDQKQIEFNIELRKSNPEIGNRFRAGGHMMGNGSHDGGYCW